VNTIEFRVVLLPVARGSGTWRVVVIVVDGVPLIERVRELELPYAEAEEIERADEFADFPPGTLAGELAGNYVSLSTNFAWPSRHFLGEPLELPHGGDEGETMVLACTCGINDCWALLTRVVLTEQTVTWSGFRNNSRDWDLSGLGPFVFDRSEYEDALRTSGE
jgi:hypothetical protein